MAHPNTRPTVEERLWAKVDVRGPDDCWNWTATTTSQGYPNFAVRQDKIQSPYRYLWEQAHGEIIKSKTIFKKCGNKLCVNLRHCELVNSRRVPRRAPPGRNRLGEKNPVSVLTNADVREIRRLFKSGKEHGVSLAKKYGVTSAHIIDIVNRETWRHI